MAQLQLPVFPEGVTQLVLQPAARLSFGSRGIVADRDKRFRLRRPAMHRVQAFGSSVLCLKKRDQVLGIERLLGAPEDVIDLEVLRCKFP
jgi:hypothetical protein